jgi:hypothetical protein
MIINRFGNRALAILLIIVFCFSCCIFLPSCGESYEEVKTSSDYIRDEIKYELKGRFYSSGYSIQSFSTNISKDGDSRYEVSGTVTLKDSSGNTWKGSYDAVVRYYEDSDSYDVSSFSMGKIYKQR